MLCISAWRDQSTTKVLIATAIHICLLIFMSDVERFTAAALEFLVSIWTLSANFGDCWFYFSIDIPFFFQFLWEQLSGF
ncbi:hypothetical protein VNO78_26815 [Psophocarpus tetragonolobus]|uniref:Uncharacterized protein n=1 Tax=Psophocarpus tetragonolobus TaxID=3891 RepID=A0AAN9S057_PSOTE